MIKKIIYILCFIVLGVLVSFLVHAAIEIPIINLLVSDFDRYGLGLSWAQWQMIHDVGTVVLLILGMIVGYMQGRYWWQMIYVQKKFRK